MVTSICIQICDCIQMHTWVSIYTLNNLRVNGFCVEAPFWLCLIGALLDINAFSKLHYLLLHIHILWFIIYCARRGNVTAAISWNYVLVKGKFNLLDRNYMWVASPAVCIVSGWAGNTGFFFLLPNNDSYKCNAVEIVFSHRSIWICRESLWPIVMLW